MGDNVLTADCLADLYALHTEIAALVTPTCDVATKVQKESNQCTVTPKSLQDLCEGGSYSCVMSNLLDAWDPTMGTPTWTANAPTSWSLTDLNTKYNQAQLESMLGDAVFDDSSNVVHAKAVKVRGDRALRRCIVVT